MRSSNETEVWSAIGIADEIGIYLDQNCVPIIKTLVQEATAIVQGGGCTAASAPSRWDRGAWVDDYEALCSLEISSLVQQLDI
ncbi:hypothetical protein EVAR_91462_1 [Eumeta japonica]|uniref:Uncharacterized protein n=1 Tax=Eumeta variegata TaxID=151549 RepID=A0A4C1X160_EUMVA|nr:hypothetical protein EVAR_91462_1 [Eumeta japonica]